jgi:hypothetical protein
MPSIMAADSTNEFKERNTPMAYRVYSNMGGRMLLVWQTDDWLEACRIARSMAGYVVTASGVRVFGVTN